MVPDTDTQRAQLAALLRRIHESPFHRTRLSQSPLTDVGTNVVLAQLPLTRRAELVRDQLEHLPHGTRRFADAPPPVRAGVSGSGADLLVLTWSAADLAQERAAGTRVLGALGVRTGMRVTNTLPGALATPGSLLLGDVLEDLGALDIPLGALDSDAAARQAWELIDRVTPQILVLDEPAASRLFGVAATAPRDWWEGIVWLQCSGVAVQRPPVPDAAGFVGWQRTWFAVPEARSFVAHSCAAARFHVDSGVLPEIVDDATGAPLPPGHDGTLALTTLGGDTPLLRYASGVRAHEATTQCSCGESGFVLELT